MFAKRRGPSASGYWLHHYHPGRRRVWQFVAVLVTIALVYLGYIYGVRTGEVRSESRDRELALLNHEVARLRDERVELQAHQTVLKNENVIATRSAREVRDTVAALELRVLELTQELDFYKSIVSASSAERGIRVQSLRVSRGEDRQIFAFQVTLIQVLGRGKSVKGSVSLTLTGTRDGEAHDMPLSELSTVSAIPFSFRYFQRLTGRLTVPDDFQPTDLRLSIMPRTRGVTGGDTTMAWSEAVSQEAS